MAIICCRCKYVMTKLAAIWYFSDQIYYIFQSLYSLYMMIRRSCVQDYFITQLNKKEIHCPVCLKFNGWMDATQSFNEKSQNKGS
ncbi:hypothetical protein A3J41_01945 [candidate division TM6 bacterium RIFCSPHIGHO2_12_FULL_38_8]|nr:MAG: hypothetical protein A3J41_01945 [candidate division TM6 bacterium RIFCSPHIGHO2_12_FULL_38_8]